MLLALKRLSSRYRNFREVVRSQILPSLNSDHDPFNLCVADHKKSDTLYVLATGSSINSLPDAAWADIRASDSLGINFWLYHEHAPTWLSFEISRTPADAATMISLLKKRLPDYQNTAFLFKDINKLDERYPIWHQEFPLSHIRHCYTLFSTSVRGRTESSLRRSLRWSRRLGLFAKKNILWALPMKRATIFLALSFGLMAGYKRVVLCGVDLNNAAYFYDGEYYQKSGDLPATPKRPPTSEALERHYSSGGVKMNHAPNASIHNTIDPALNPLPMDSIIHAFNEEVLKHTGVELFVALPSSLLHPRIPALYHSANNVNAET